MSKCSNPARCDGYQWLCGRCRRAFPTLARQYDARKQEQRESRQNRNNGGGSQWSTQDRNSDATVRVSGGYNRRTHGNYDADEQRTDFEIFDKTSSDGVEKTHMSIDTDGNSTVWHGNDSFGS